MAFKYQDLNLANIVYGFGTATTYGNFNTTVLNTHYKTGNVAMRCVPKNSNFMPFSDMDIDGYKNNGANLLTASAYAAVNRFIVSGASDKITRTDSDITPIYYKGNGYSGRGELYIGGTAVSNRVSSDCPSVILIAIQGAGGSGSSGLARGHNFLLGTTWQHVGGNGGGSGGFACFQVNMPYGATSPTLVGYFQVSGSSTSLRDFNNLTFASVGAGGTGGSVSGTPSLFDSFYSHVQGSGGAAGSVTIFSLTYRPTLRNASFNTSTGATTGSTTGVLIGAVGGQGGYNFGNSTSSVSERYASSGGSGKTGLTIYLNNASSGNSISGKAGGAGGSNPNTGGTGYTGAGGGGGAGSMFGIGGAGNSAPGSTAYGAGGGGGTPTKTSWAVFDGTSEWVSGKAGASGCVKFFW